ncbi:hypothetical protein PTI98_010130 [Pleurotus ostreatus]|uniref:Uncharacterized protein n=1 Tax=Pleurotus cornucopiae TaxID=5321 RepID=A0ACB7J3Z0_PLECO|nr:hypothetical protein CCMSSC00406_0002134 [Pleurotus cornucopiae]KAJ8692860.1 hypothetical protein PTI98_010130 [Pleurotus ostreatus]
MQFQLAFIATLLVVLYAGNVDALPAKRGAGMVSLPLRRVQQLKRDVHPHILMQQHINRSQRRFARMTGRDGPTDADLVSNLEKRLFLLPSDPKQHGKRYNIGGTKHTTTSAPDLSAASISTKAQTKEGGSDPIVAATDNADGVSDVEIEALANGGIAFADTPAADNSIGLDIIANDVGYFATILLGTPPREFRVIMDSGSADLWVGAEDCDSDTATGCGNHVFLGGISSTTFEDSQRPFQITYGTGAVVGTIVRDNLKLAGLSLDGHIFGVAHNESKEFAGNDVAFDGILGTAQSTLSNQKTLTAVESLAQNGLIQDPITSYKISRLDDQKNDGVITFGGLDETKFDPSTLVTVDNLSRVGFWEAAMDKITVDGADTRLTRRTAILDTGTTLILAPDADARALHQAIPGARSDGQGGFIIPCTTNATIALTFGGREFTIDPRDLVFAPLNLNDPTGDCFSGITSGSIGGANQWLVGDVFLKSAYFSHNVKTNSMSLAALA